ncbi:hypothetical protein V1477_019130 [Vespula maculifrons]|uniref:Uncharacterized protein n=1 Tax=Vespula maculifrons TaxID=7453 RepID=A0ABD2ARN9_VESMC
MTFVVRWYGDVESANNTEPLTGTSRVTFPLGRIARVGERAEDMGVELDVLCNRLEREWPIGFEVGVIYGVWRGRGVWCFEGRGTWYLKWAWYMVFEVGVT